MWREGRDRIPDLCTEDRYPYAVFVAGQATGVRWAGRVNKERPEKHRADVAFDIRRLQLKAAPAVEG